MTARARDYLRTLEELGPEALDRLDPFLAPDVRFRDPFNDLRGAEAFKRALAHMYEKLDDVKFTAHHFACEGDVCLVDWTFTARLSATGRELHLVGMSRVDFDAEGRVTAHIDHWDAAGQVYAGLPVIGGILSLIRRRLSSPQD